MITQRTEIGQMLEDFDPPLSLNEIIIKKKNWDKKRKGGSKPKNDLVGRRFGRLVAVRLSPKIAGQRERTWECRCDCGKTNFVRGGHLRSGNTTSCGCGRANLDKSFRGRFLRLIEWVTPEDRAWAIERLKEED